MPELKPTSYPDWATDDVILPVAGTSNKIEPRTIMQTQGADKGNFFGAEEANWILNSNGEWTRYLDQEVQHLKDTNLREYNTVADMVADELLEDGDYARTLGYHTFGDTGGAIYKVSAAEGTVDGMTLIALDNGLRAEFVYVSNTYSPIQFGAVGNGVADDSVPMQKLADLLEDNPSNTNLQEGVVIDLHGRRYSVALTPQNKLTIKNGILRQVSEGNNVIEHIEGSAKSDGWDLLRLENVTIDGANKGSGTITEEDGFGGYTLDSGNMGLYFNVASTSVAKRYKVELSGCVFTGLHNSMFCYINSVPSGDLSSITVIDSEFKGANTVSTIANINIIVDTSDVERDAAVFRGCNIEVNNGLLYTKATKCVFDKCPSIILNFALDVTTLAALYGRSNASFYDSNIFMPNQDTVEGKFTRDGYNLDVRGCTIDGDFRVDSTYTGDNSALNFSIKDSEFKGLKLFRYPAPSGFLGGPRPEMHISVVGCTQRSATLNSISISLEDEGDVQSITGGGSDRLLVSGNNATGAIGVTTYGEAYIVYTNNMEEDISGAGGGIRLGSSTVQLTCTGNILKGGASSVSYIVTDKPNVDTVFYYAIAGNWYNGANILESDTDGSTLPASHNR